MNGLTKAAQDVLAERQRQDEKWGGPTHDDEHTVAQWVELIQDYAGWARVMAGMDSHDKARRRLVQVAALALAAAESIDRTHGVTGTPGGSTDAIRHAEAELEEMRRHGNAGDVAEAAVQLERLRARGVKEVPRG